MKKLLLFSILTILLISLSTVSADDNETIMSDENSLNVSGNKFDDIQNTIDKVESNSTVNLNGTYTGSKEIKIEKDITIEGNGATLDANHKSRILTISKGNVVLKNINFVNALSKTSGGAILANGNLTLINCNFTNNSVNADYEWYSKTKSQITPDDLGEGGAVYSNNDLTVINSNFINNSAIYIAQFREMDWYFSSDEGNGGGIFTKGKLHLEKSRFLNNTGSVIVSYGDADIQDCIFKDQSSTLAVMDDSIVYLINSSFNNCGFEPRNPIYDLTYPEIYCGNMEIYNCNFTNNVNMLILGENAIIKGCFFENNSQNIDDYHLIEVDNINIINSTFKNNSNINSGIIKLQSLNDIEDCSFENNSDAAILVNGNLYDDNLNQMYLFKAKIRNKLTKTYYNSNGKITVDLINLKSGSILDDLYVDHDIYRNGKQYYQEWFYESLTFPVSTWKVGTYNVVINYIESYVQPREVSFTITIKKAPTIVKAPKVTHKYKKSKYFKITLKNKITKKAAKKVLLKVKIGKKTYNVKTNKKGIAKFNTKNLKVGTYKVKITSGNENYKISAKSTIKIKW
ncbi:hypothetical protein [Methanobrevibacter sp.]|uniref:hypothetical protein n=1 Tax=Methanobrevibacter sp. TaxID=66852 RepID=UPI0038908D1E